MRAIIIDEKDALALLDQLRLEKFTAVPHGANTVHICETLHMTRAQYESLAADMHRRFHYIVTRWLQEQGASCVR